MYFSHPDSQRIQFSKPRLLQEIKFVNRPVGYKPLFSPRSFRHNFISGCINVHREWHISRGVSMSVSEILGGKGGEVITSTPETSLVDVATVLAKHKIGALVVKDGGKVCGIVSERDLVRHIAQDGSDALQHTISQCMTKSVISCKRSDTIDLVMEKMTTGRFRHLPVIEGGELLGIISIGDVVKRKIEQTERDAEELKRYIAS
jgi:CBS domain-containing protein